MEKRCSVWNTRILWSGSLKTVAREVARYRLDLVVVRGTVEARNEQRIFFCLDMEMKIVRDTIFYCTSEKRISS
jgi:hypothetical protein